MASSRRVFLGLYAASGAAALVYEVTWTRLLTLQLGHTVAAASTVLAAFMGGLAIGAWIAGQWNGLKAVPYHTPQDDTPNKPPAPSLVGRGLQAVPSFLRTYAVLELLVAATAVALPVALRASVPALAWAYADGAAPARFAIVRIVISLALVGVPAAAMGATFPIATTWYARNAADTGVLYAANTAGAALGAIAAGFFLIPAVGLRATTWVGVALNVLAAAGAWWISAKAPDLPAQTAAASPTNSLPRRSSRRSRASEGGRSPRLNVDTRAPSPLLAYGAVALSGFAALVYEVAWTRLLALVIGPTTYAFATMAAACS